ncbi:MAG: hypothetical protein GXZ13_07475 [Synergistaceae bacterium]|nr:hypothetical protein [Synergistaceae bacterium]
MGEARQIINFDEAVKKPANLGLVERISVLAAKLIFLILLVAIVVFKINLFSQSSLLVKTLYILLNIYAIPLMLKTKEVPSPVEFRFYGRYLVVDYPRKYYSKKDTRKEEFIFKNSEIDYAVYKMDSKVLSIRGQAKSKHYSFNKEGQLDENSEVEGGPREVKLDFDLRFLEGLEIIESFEKYTRVRVLVSKG